MMLQEPFPLDYEAKSLLVLQDDGCPNFRDAVDGRYSRTELPCVVTENEKGASQTKISWTHWTWNPWEGCKRISAGCKNCYMFSQLERFGRNPGIVRRTTTTWDKPLRCQRKAEKADTVELVFTCSLSDWFIEEADAWRPEAWEIIRNCPNLIFQILTKRPHLILDRLPSDWGKGYPNVWLGVSIENGLWADRADILREIPARIRFISAEPLLGSLRDLNLDGFQWLIAGGESGRHYRDMDLNWARELRDKCVAAEIAFFFKQSSHRFPGRGDKLDGREWKQWPT